MKVEKKMIKGMNKSCCKLNEMEILKKYLTESQIFGENFDKNFTKNENALNLIYKASKDGFGVKDFHRKCDGISKVVVLIKANDFLFGGYTPQSWNSRNYKERWVYCDQTFIFSLSNPQNKPTIFKSVQPQYSFCDFASYGPCFGCINCDIFISDNSDEKASSYSFLGYTYKGKN